MDPLLRSVLYKGVIGYNFFVSSEVIILVVLNEGAFCVIVSIAVRVTIGLSCPVLVVKNYVWVSVYALDSNAETI